VSDTTAWLTDTLWPVANDSSPMRPVNPAAVRAGRFVAVPNAAAPTQLIPWRPASVWAATRRATDDRSRLRLVADGVGVAGLLVLAQLSRERRVDVEATIEGSLVETLRQQIDPAIRSAIVLWGPPRANRKPVLQLSDRFGRTVAFAKVAWNDLTIALLDREESSLRHLSSLVRPGFIAPEVLGRQRFGDVEWLALSPATVTNRRPATDASAFALANLVERSAPQRLARLESSSFIDRLRADSTGRAVAQPLVEELVGRHADRELRTAAWHGDFVPWNFLSGEPSSAIWDWERYDTDVPLGFDRLHYALQMQLHRKHLASEVAVRSLLVRSAALVPQLAASDADLHAQLYLAEIVTRYEHDADLANSPALHQRVADLAGALRRSWSR
jgi:hypothetical protein